MAEALAEKFSEPFLRSFAGIVKEAYASFDSDTFMSLVLDEHWHSRQLKQRIRHISTSLGQTLPSQYDAAIAILSDISPRCTGFEYLFFPDFVERYGLQHWEASMKALALFTSSSSAEFAVRPFIVQDQDRMMEQMLEWANDANPHIRRLASEGCRPKLPWATPLRMFIHNPAPILPILEQLKEDESEYVRKSVANNINDIAKNHPELIKQLTQQWLGQHSRTDWILKHGCRTLLRKADPDILALFGLNTAPDVKISEFTLNEQQVPIGESLGFSFSLQSNASTAQQLRVEYGIDFVKANGKASRKLFKITETAYDQTIRTYTRTHSFRNLTTRKHYSGVHRLSIIVNGVEQASKEFNLIHH